MSASSAWGRDDSWTAEIDTCAVCGHVGGEGLEVRMLGSSIAGVDHMLTDMLGLTPEVAAALIDTHLTLGVRGPDLMADVCAGCAAEQVESTPIR